MNAQFQKIISGVTIYGMPTKKPIKNRTVKFAIFIALLTKWNLFHPA